MNKCHSKECNNEATHEVMWTDGWHAYCWDCAKKLIGIGDMLGFPARQSLRLIEVEKQDESEDTLTSNE